MPRILGKKARSKFEGDVFEDILDKKGPKQKVEYEVDKLPYTIHHNYIPDFKITKKDGSVMYIEAKGLGRAFDAASRAKMVAIKRVHPELDIRIVFMSDRVITKGGKMTPSVWAEKYGFPYSIKTIPKEWMNE